MGIRPETSRMGSADMRFQLSKNSVQAVDRPDLPSQGQYIAPMAIRMKQRLEQSVVGFRKSPFEPRKPMVTLVAMFSVLASIRALKLSICAASPGSTTYASAPYQANALQSLSRLSCPQT